MKSELRIGISGWTYPPWRNGAFYPAKWPHKRELEYASRRLNSIEINGTFYSLQKPASFQSWYDATPPGFLFSLKGGRFITHIRRLREAEVPLANFFASGVLCLRDKLGPILWQLPPNFKYDEERLKAFFETVPRDTELAAKLARKHDERGERHYATETDQNRPLRHALEVRHDSFKSAEFIDLLRRHDIGLVIADTGGKWPAMEDVTSDFVYLRLHGPEELYSGGYDDEALEAWARKIRNWQKGENSPADQCVGAKLQHPKRPRDVYIYFDNDAKVRSPVDAQALANRLGVEWNPPGASD